MREDQKPRQVAADCNLQPWQASTRGKPTGVAAEQPVRAVHGNNQPAMHNSNQVAAAGGGWFLGQQHAAKKSAIAEASAGGCTTGPDKGGSRLDLGSRGGISTEISSSVELSREDDDRTCYEATILWRRSSKLNRK
ncbi:hypothetical protein Acr_00g0021340 [Actinidia rufa]|uniref:Uncharacterized protein n=1 Tax=Actinidia rufa TaxID=165716 RepID=A0A7J0DC95_9ERIC|nr:hypothetical protein Acr_00g0021340 [Actinidia rufa]